jgi:hypothetical protein
MIFLLGVGQDILFKAVTRVSGRNERQIRDSLVRIGDLGVVLSESKSNTRTMESFFVKKETKPITVIIWIEGCNFVANGCNDNFAQSGRSKRNFVSEHKELSYSEITF